MKRFIEIQEYPHFNAASIFRVAVYQEDKQGAYPIKRYRTIMKSHLQEYIQDLAWMTQTKHVKKIIRPMFFHRGKSSVSWSTIEPNQQMEKTS